MWTQWLRLDRCNSQGSNHIPKTGTSVRSCPTSDIRERATSTVDTEGVATSMTLSVSWANASRGISLEEAKTMYT